MQGHSGPPAKYVLNTVRLRDKNDYKQNDFYKTCLEKVLAYNVKSVAFCCGTIGIPGFDPREAAKMAICHCQTLVRIKSFFN